MLRGAIPRATDVRRFAPKSSGSPGADRGAAREADHTTPPRAAKNSSSLTFTALHPSCAVN